MMEPLKPEDVVDAKKDSLPDEVMKAFNELIAEHWDGVSSQFKQKEAIEKIMKKLPKITSQDVLDKDYLNIEEVFRAVGWVVIYDKPAYNESYEPTFEFRKER